MKYLIITIALILGFWACETAMQETSIDQEKYSEAKNLYATNCSSCHGVKMEMFVDRKWKHGNEPDSIASSIKSGYPDLGMPSFDTLFNEEQVNKLVEYISYGIENRESYTFKTEFDADSTFEADGVRFNLSLITDEVEVPWGFTFLPNNDMLITNKSGQLYFKANNTSTLKEISGVPEVVDAGQGGLLDIEQDPNFAENKLIYISYSKGKDGKQTTAVIRAKLEADRLAEVTEIFEAQPYLTTKHHYGSRLEFDDEGYLFLSVGDRGKQDDNPQSLGNHCGKIHRINTDGSIPEDNPFVNTEGAMPSIYSYGHRNPQGLVFDKSTGTLWEHEHGPRGGDELNIINKGENYGWPVVSFGINYNGTTFTNKTEMEGMTNSEKYWVPSIAPCGMAQVTSDKYPGWENDLLVASLRFKYLNKVTKDMSEVSMLKNIGRVRNVKLDQEGYIYVGTEAPGAIYKLIPVE